jgi:hypothetical protein
MPVVSKNIQISGIYPLDQVRILSKWSGWRMCSKQTGLVVIGKLTMLTNIAKRWGRILDGEIEDCLESILTFDAATRKSDDCAFNHNPCTWMNKINAKRQIEMVRTVQRDNIIMENVEWTRISPFSYATQIYKVLQAA